MTQHAQEPLCDEKEGMSGYRVVSVLRGVAVAAVHTYSSAFF